MKILLTTLNSKFIHSNLAVKYLYTVAMDEGFDLNLREYTINNEEGYIFGEIMQGDYDVVCFSCYVWNIEKILYLSENLKKANPGITVVLGGPEVTYDAVEMVMENDFIDFVIQGEGEYTFRELCGALQDIAAGKGDKGSLLPGIEGIVYRLDGKVHMNQPRPLLVMESIKNPYLYIATEKEKILYYESSRGCPRRCAYCMSSVERHMRALSLDRVKDDLSYFLLKRVKQVKFIDRTFNYDADRAYEIFQYLTEMDNGVTNFHMELCADLVDEKTFELLEKARKGLFQFEIGVQSTNRETLSAVNRSTDVVLVLKNIARLVSFGNIHIHTDLIAGLPHEGYDSFAASFNNVYNTGAQQIQLGFLKLLKGTQIRREADIHGYVYRSKAPYQVISNKYISAKDLVRLHQIEDVFDVFYNMGGFRRSIELCVTKNENPFRFFEEFAVFYNLKGYQHESHSKEDNYRILYRYGQWKDRQIEGFAEELQKLLKEDMKERLNKEAVKKFEKRGWDMEESGIER